MRKLTILAQMKENYKLDHFIQIGCKLFSTSSYSGLQICGQLKHSHKQTLRVANNIADVSVNCHVKRDSQVWPFLLTYSFFKLKNTQSSVMNLKLACTAEIKMFQ